MVSDSRYIFDHDPLLWSEYSFLPYFCWITKQSILRICPEFAFSLLFFMLLWLMAASGCVWERGGECRLGTWPESPLFRTYHAKVLLIRLIKCFVGTGPTLHATNTSSSTTPTPLCIPLSFTCFLWDFSAPFIITSETLATFSLTVCQRMFLPVKC